MMKRLAVALVFLCLLRPPLAGGSALVSNVFFDTDIRQALQDVAQQAGVTIIPDQTVTGLVSATIKDATLERALTVLLAGTGYAFKATDDYYLIFSQQSSGPAFDEISAVKVFNLRYIKAKKALNLLPSRYRQYVTSDEESDSLLVSAPKSQMAQIQAIVDSIDQAPRHVLLDARVVVLEQGNLLNMGFNWNWPNIEAGAFTDSTRHGDWPWAIKVGMAPGPEFTNALLLTLDLLKQNDEASIVASPQVVAQNNKTAEIKVATEEWFKIVTEGVYNSSELEKIETGTVLNILPRINETGDITLQISSEVSDVIARGEDNLPVVTRRKAQSTVRMEDGGTMAIAGLMDSRSRQVNTSTPFFSRLPLIGYLFDHVSDSKTDKQVAIFITARILKDRGDPGVKLAENRKRVARVEEEAFKLELEKELSAYRKAGKE